MLGALPLVVDRANRSPLVSANEWAAAYTQKFGIVHVDLETMARTPKASARWYRDVIAHRGL